MALGLIHNESSAHNPNENINLPFAKKLTKSIGYILGEIGKQ